MKYNFDHIIDRHGTYSTQWDYIADRFGRNDILPFSISDTDFPVPQAVQTALSERMQHPIYGYTRWNHADYKNSIVNWFKQRDQATIDPAWICYSPSVVWSIGTLIRLKSQPGDAVATFTPMYDAFYGVIEQNERLLMPVRLAAADKGYQIDWDSLATVLAQPQVKLFLLTNPHNPTGKVFSKTELAHLVALAQQYHVFIISDDIHKDIVYGPVKYTPLTALTQTNIMLACSATKSFNTPGLGGAYLLLPDPKLRTAFMRELKQKNALSSASIFGITAQMACYSAAGAEYLDQLVPYLQANLQYVQTFLAQEIPKIHFTVPEGTYLAWLNVAQLNLTSDKLQAQLVNIGHVGIMPGATYGDSQYLRMNVACPRPKLEEGLRRLLKGVDA
ncbi:MalY/PatB family protein [Loigolactobacillus binensis]|uniref:cysteine-S-conjugate beta-lyase n=1 Tax=Loigolactobacillus binensis TaxID=2559922 RepID=A0ABW3EBH2_9LACO|nr:PatB family C-S lyase [Loigolactobacillus binensis]